MIHDLIHGKQGKLMMKSRCYQVSKTMECSTCHDVHKTERDAAAFSSRCLTCHQPKQCGEFSKRGEEISKNCIDCHMPLQQSQVLFSKTNGKKVQPMVRNHLIGIYPGNKPQ